MGGLTSDNPLQMDSSPRAESADMQLQCNLTTYYLGTYSAALTLSRNAKVLCERMSCSLAAAGAEPLQYMRALPISFLRIHRPASTPNHCSRYNTNSTLRRHLPATLRRRSPQKGYQGRESSRLSSHSSTGPHRSRGTSATGSRQAHELAGPP